MPMFDYAMPQQRPPLPPMPGGSPMPPMAPPPAPPQAFDYQSGWGQNTPGMAAMQPPPAPPVPMSNPTGGPMPQTTSPQRAGVYSQLYKLGRQAQGPQNMFAQFDPNAQAQDPLAPLMPPAPVAPPGPAHAVSVPPTIPGQMQPPYAQQAGGPPQQVDRFPRLSRLMGRPILPDPNVGSAKKQGGY